MLEPYHQYEQIAPAVWLMSDHKWAWYAWESSLRTRPLKLIHLDYHWDNLNDFRSPADIDYLRSIVDLNEIHNLTASDKDHRVREDSFIAPAIIRGLVNEIHFCCVSIIASLLSHRTICRTASHVWAPLVQKSGESSQEYFVHSTKPENGCCREIFDTSQVALDGKLGYREKRSTS